MTKTVQTPFKLILPAKNPLGTACAGRLSPYVVCDGPRDARIIFVECGAIFEFHHKHICLEREIYKITNELF